MSRLKTSVYRIMMGSGITLRIYFYGTRLGGMGFGIPVELKEEMEKGG